MFSVIFDMDGTLLDTQKICLPAWEYGGNKQGITGVGNLIYKVCGMNENGWTNCLLENFPQIDTVQFKKDAREYISKNGKLALKKGAKELLDFLKENNIKIGLASGSSITTIEHHLKEVNVRDYFDAIAGGLEVENGKPAPDVFLLAAKRLGADPWDCYVFEDSANGILAGHNAGMKCIGVPDIVDFESSVKELMTAEFTSLDEAIPLFKKLVE